MGVPQYCGEVFSNGVCKIILSMLSVFHFNPKHVLTAFLPLQYLSFLKFLATKVAFPTFADVQLSTYVVNVSNMLSVSCHSHL